MAAEPGPDPWADALSAAALLAVDPVGLGGIALRARAGPVRERWLAHLRELLPAAMPLRRVPLHIGDERLLGGLDLAATLRAGRPVAQSGLLTQADGGLLLLAMAERLAVGTVARLASAMDRGEVQAEREGMTLQGAARFGVVAFDEGASDDERLAAPLADRLAFLLDLTALSHRDADDWPGDAATVAAARKALAALPFDAAIVQALCEATQALGIDSPRAAWLAWRTACASAALRGSPAVEAEDAALAARLVLAPRATRLPPQPPPEEAQEQEPPEAPPEDQPPADESAAPPPPDTGEDSEPAPTQPLEDLLIETAQAAIPAGLLAALAQAQAPRAGAAGRAGVWTASPRGGRPIGSRRGDPRGGARLALVDTLRAAAPWQLLRQREAEAATPGAARRIQVRADDFHVQRCRQRSATTTVFVIDASGSSALHRLAEAKGAVNLLLADCYVRRDSVAVMAFRGRTAELLLPPTRSLVRAKRSLGGLPGGGGTPLAAGIEAALALAHQVQRGGATPVLVFLTDGRANIARDGSGGRAQAEADALRAARQLRGSGFASLLIDTSPQPAAAARRLAAEMTAQYRALPQAGARALSQAVRGLQPGPAGRG
jgi:magnesium chelatase subunit D